MPPQLHVFVRDWLSSNNVLLKSRDGHVLDRLRLRAHAPLTLALLATQRGLGDEPLARLVNTHCHSDHIGGNAAIARNTGARSPFPRAKRRWSSAGTARRCCSTTRTRAPIASRADETLCPASTYVWGDLEWQALAAPGHDMGALVFYNPEHGILISGDALWENGFGFVMPPEIDARRAAGDARDARDAGRARRPRRHSRSRRAVH